jgi:hypothetical protein
MLPPRRRLAVSCKQRIDDEKRLFGGIDAVETKLHIDREIYERRRQRTQSNAITALALPKEQHKREDK